MKLAVALVVDVSDETAISRLFCNAELCRYRSYRNTEAVERVNKPFILKNMFFLFV